MSEPDFISVRGAREHNLKGVDLEIPKKKLVVFTGVSGLGQVVASPSTPSTPRGSAATSSRSRPTRASSSGRWRSRSTTPLRGLSPTISIEQKAASNNPRSTVGTVTEVHDYLRVLYASIGVQHCHNCGRKVGKQSAQQIVEEILKAPSGTKVQLLAPLVQQPQGRAQGRARRRAEARLHPRPHRRQGAQSLEEKIELDKKSKHDIELVIDRLVLKPDLRAAPHRLGGDGAARRARAC